MKNQSKHISPLARLIMICTIATLSGVTHAATRTELAPKGALWVFTVGVSHYQSKDVNSLHFADHDAQALADSLKSRASGLFSAVHTKVLLNDQADRANVEAQMKDFFSSAAPSDSALIAVMGHGVEDPQTGQFYFLPYKADLKNLSTEGLSTSEFQKLISDVRHRVAQLALLLDTCHAGALDIQPRGIENWSSGPQPRGVNLIQGFTNSDYIIEASSEPNQSSLEDDDWRMPGETSGHGAFTYALLRGLNGQAARPDGTVYIFDLLGFASYQVPKLTLQMQSPYLAGARGVNFPIAEAPPPPSPQDAQQATTLVQNGLTQQKQGNLKGAADSFARAEALNPRDQSPALLSDAANKELAYRGDPKAQDDIAATADALVHAPAGQPDPWGGARLTISFLDFKTGGKPENAGLDEVIVDRIAQSLQATQRVTVVERHLLDKILQELRLSASNLSDPETRLTLGKVLNARVMASGEVMPMDGSSFILTMKIFDDETSIEEFGIQQNGKTDNLIGFSDDVASKIAAALQKKYPIQGKVLTMDGQDAVLNIGTLNGVSPGFKLNAITKEDVTVDGQVIASRTKAIGKLEVTSAEEKASFAKVLEGTVSKGTKVMETLPPPASGPKA